MTSPAILLALTLAPPVQILKPAHHGPLLDKAAAIFTRRVEARCGPATSKPVTIDLRVQPSSASGAYTISTHGAALRVTGHDEAGVLYGLGKLFRTSSCSDGAFRPGSWRGSSAPAGTLRGVYLASHFGNFYEAAPISELETYVEDLALWGVNAIGFAFPNWQYDSYDDPAAQANLTRLRAMMAVARASGIRVGAMVAPNQVFRTAPPELRAKPYPDDWGRRGNLGTNLCPSLPAARQYILDAWARLLDEYKATGLDFVVYWPYDEGGCGCSQCWPWGSRGFYRISRDMTELARRRYPQLQTVLSTWMFDTPPAGEWRELSDNLEKDAPWISYIMADAHEDFPRYPLDQDVPGRLPLVNFPEISMWGMSPWGGYGANPLPARLQMLWDQVKTKVRGGLPYSEGIYEDLNKIIATQFYWDPNTTAAATLREYIASEFSPAVVTEVTQAIAILEANHARRGNGSFKSPPHDTAKARALMESANAKLSPQIQTAWRWRILYLRALIDDELAKSGGIPQRATLAEPFAELIRIYHAEHVHTNRVAPPAFR